MVRKALTLGMAFILAISLLSASLIMCFTHDADAHPWTCVLIRVCDQNGWNCKDIRFCWHDDHNPTAD